MPEKVTNLQALSFLEASPRPTFKEIWEFQKQALEEVASGTRAELLIFCEHERLITVGRRSQEGNIRQKDLPVYEIERGGDVTYHGPGQLVVYPILRLRGSQFKGGLHEYLRFCEDVIIGSIEDLLFSKKIKVGRFGPTGVWVKEAEGFPRKIASIGIAVRKWITYHGISLNVSCDLDDFAKIRPCNFEPSVMTSLEKEGVKISVKEMAERVQSEFESQLYFPSDAGDEFNRFANF